MLPAVLPWSKRRRFVLNQRAKVFHQYRQGWVQSNSEVWDDLMACGFLGSWVLLNSFGRRSCLSVEVSEAVTAVGTDRVTVLTPHTTLGPFLSGGQLMRCVSKEEQPVMESRQSCHTIGDWREITHLLQSCYSHSHTYTSSTHYHWCSKYIINPSSSAIYIPSTSYTRAQSGVQRKKILLQSGICLGRLRPLRGESAKFLSRCYI